MKVLYTEREFRIIEQIDEAYQLDNLKGDCYDPEVNHSMHPDALKKEELQFENRVENLGVYGYTLEKWNADIGCGWEHVDSCWGFVGPYEYENHYIVAELKTQIDNVLTQDEMLQLVLDDLKRWLDLGSGDCSMRYAYDNNYKLHAASLWLSTGAMSEEAEKKIEGLRIDENAEKLEIHELCENAYIYICKECRHHAFIVEDLGDDIDCVECGKLAVISE